MSERRYLPTLSELVDRLSICQLKEVFIAEHRDEYAKEIQDILHDIDLILSDSNCKFDADTIRAIVVLAQYNLHIWGNEAACRRGIKEGNSLELSHSLNGVRCRAKNKIQEMVGGRKDFKVDCMGADHTAWEPSWSKDERSE